MKPRVLIAVGFFLCLAVVAIVLIRTVFVSPPFDERYAICYRPLPDERRAALSGSIGEGGLVEIDVNGEIGQPDVPTQGQLDTFEECVKTLTPDAKVEITNVVTIPAEPIGQVANRWRREHGGPQLALPVGNRRLSLVRIGPDTGTKAEVIGRWCASVSACVECDPPTPTADTVEVGLALRPDAPLIRKEMLGSGDRWPVPPIGADGEPLQEAWQDVDASGVRWFLECQSVTKGGA